MRAFVNELALAEACAIADPSYAPLEALLAARAQFSVLRQALYCSRGMPETVVSASQKLSDIGRAMPRDKIGLLFQWVNKRGPFLDDHKESIDDDLFMLDEDDVTELGLGEAARRLVASRRAATLSSVDVDTSRFSAESLKIIHGLVEEPISVISVPNYTSPAELAKKLRSVRQPTTTTWNELLINCRNRFDRLNIGTHCERVLARIPYNPAAGRRIWNLLDLLQRIMTEMDENGRLSCKGKQLYYKHFVGKRAWFSDESDTRKAEIQTFTFPDPAGKGQLVCYWHGKVSTRSFRVHFEWPVKRPSESLKVAYIGPHL